MKRTGDRRPARPAAAPAAPRPAKGAAAGRSGEVFGRFVRNLARLEGRRPEAKDGEERR